MADTFAREAEEKVNPEKKTGDPKAAVSDPVVTPIRRAPWETKKTEDK